MARPTRTGAPSTRRIQFRVSAAEHAELVEATAELNLDWSAFIRDALAEALSDWREKRVFQRRQENVAVAVDRRGGTDRRQAGH